MNQRAQTMQRPGQGVDQELWAGMIVGYVLAEGPSKGQMRPAMITRVGATGTPGTSPETVQLAVFTDAAGDGPPYQYGVHPVSGVSRDDGGKMLGTFHVDRMMANQASAAIPGTERG